EAVYESAAGLFDAGLVGHAPEDRLLVVRRLRALLGCGLAEAVALVRQAPSVIRRAVPYAAAGAARPPLPGPPPHRVPPPRPARGGVRSEERACLGHRLDEPQDEAARLIYADWLDEQGDARAHYLRLEVERARLPEGERRSGVEAELARLAARLDPEWVLLVG